MNRQCRLGSVRERHVERETGRFERRDGGGDVGCRRASPRPQRTVTTIESGASLHAYRSTGRDER